MSTTTARTTKTTDETILRVLKKAQSLAPHQSFHAAANTAASVAGALEVLRHVVETTTGERAEDVDWPSVACLLDDMRHRVEELHELLSCLEDVVTAMEDS